MESGMTADEAFKAAIAHWSESLFTDTPQGKSLFASGAAFVLERLQGCAKAKEWQKVRDEMADFAEAYMQDSRRRMADPLMVKAREALQEWEQLRERSQRGDA
jgi:flavorubredoxin